MSEETQSPEQSLAEQVVNRRAARERIAALGHPLHPNRFPATHLVSDVVERWAGSDSAALEAETDEARLVAVPGRILAIRKMGKAVFLDLSDGRTRVQAYVRKDGVGDGGWALLENLDLGDHVGVTGVVFRTRTGELSVKAEGLAFLAKCLRPLPDKWHGLTDVEIKYRQRYVDLIVSEETRRTFEARARVVSYLRRFLDARGFLEVETPMMQPIAGGAAARPFMTHHNTLDVDLYLRIAPELYLKRLVTGGFPKVYEINRNFRNEGISTQHNPEFTMLEFYTAYADARDQMALTEEFLAGAAREILGTTQLPWGEETISFEAPFRRLSMKDAVVEYGRDVPGGAIRPEELETLDGLKAAADARRDRGARTVRRRSREAPRGALRDPRRAAPPSADLRRRLPGRDLAARQDPARRPDDRRPVRALRRPDGAGERLLRAERPRRAGREVPRPGGRAGEGDDEASHDEDYVQAL